MREDPLAPARGVLIGVIAGSIIWAVILLIVWAAFIYEPAQCGVDLYHTPALGNVVEC